MALTIVNRNAKPIFAVWAPPHSLPLPLPSLLVGYDGVTVKCRSDFGGAFEYLVLCHGPTVIPQYGLIVARLNSEPRFIE